MTLWSDFLTNKGRMIHRWTHYFPIYERHFAPLVNRPITFLEIGLGEGGSLAMWQRHFGPRARIVGLDINPDAKAFEDDQIAVRIGNQADRTFLAAVLEEFGPPDAVVDDGSHIMEHLLATFDFLYPRLTPAGIYVVEDLHTAYMPGYGGGLRRSGTFIERCKDLIDELNADYAGPGLLPTEFTHSTISMHIYDSVVVFERGHQLKRSMFSPAPGTDKPGRGYEPPQMPPKPGPAKF